MRSSLLLFAAATTSALAQSNATCYNGVRVIHARGTGEPQDSSVEELMAKAILRLIPDSYSTEVIYPASGDPSSVGVGVSNAQSQVYSYARECPDSKIVLMGYSQGARVIGNAIAGGNATNSPVAEPLCSSISPNIVAIVLFGDPDRKLGVGVDSDVGGPSCNVSANTPRSGSALTSIENYADRLSEWCNYDDFVCCSTGTTFAAHLSYWTNENADTVASYVSSKAASATLTSATLGSTCTAVGPPTVSATSASTTASRSSSASVKPSGSVGSVKPSGSASSSGSVKATTGGLATPTKTPSTPTGATGTTSAGPSTATQTTNAGAKMQMGMFSGAAAAFAGALIL